MTSTHFYMRIRPQEKDSRMWTSNSKPCDASSMRYRCNNRSCNDFVFSM